MSDQINQHSEEFKKKKTIFKTTKSKVILIIGVLLFAFITISGIAVGKHFSMFKDGPEGIILEKVIGNLNLTQDQQARVQIMRDQIKEKMGQRKSVRENLMEDFANEFKKDNLDKSKLEELSNRRDQEASEMKEFVMDRIIEFHDILTTEQRNQAIENVKSLKNKFHDGVKGHKNND